MSPPPATIRACIITRCATAGTVFALRTAADRAASPLASFPTAHTLRLNPKGGFGESCAGALLAINRCHDIFSCRQQSDSRGLRRAWAATLRCSEQGRDPARCVERCLIWGQVRLV